MAFALQCLIDFFNVAKVGAALGSSSPGLDEFEDLALDVVVDGSSVGLDQRGQVVDELARGNLGHEVGAAILDARVGEVQGSNLDVWILVAYAAFQRAHGLFGLHRLGADDVRNLEIEGDVLQTGRGSALDLLIEGRVAGAEPGRHGACTLSCPVALYDSSKVMYYCGAMLCYALCVDLAVWKTERQAGRQTGGGVELQRSSRDSCTRE